MLARTTTIGLLAAMIILTTARPLSPAGAAEIEAAMLRFPDVSRTQIAFVYDNDVWTVPKEGGVASPLSSPAGQEQHPKFSPDGRSVAFSANYDGNFDVFVMPVEGGTPRRLTYHPNFDRVVEYAPDGRVVFNSWRDAGYPASKLYYADPQGGLPEALPMAYAAFASFSPDGGTVAFTPWTREWSTWNRYQGGTATDIWLMDMETLEAQRITEHPGTDDMPMYRGGHIYYMSDAGPAHRRNIWRYDTVGGSREQVTHFTEDDVKWPSIGPEDIVFECGEALYLLSLDTHTARRVEVTIPGDHPSVRPQLLDVSDYRRGTALSPSARRITASVRGDIWTMPAEEGFKRNLTRSDGVAERSPAWSPDGKWIAYFSDSSGEYELYIQRADGSGETRQLTSGSRGFYYNPTWSPDSKKIAYSDQTGTIWLRLIDEEETLRVDKDPWGSQWLTTTWATDSNWLAYTLADERTSNGVIKLYDLSSRAAHQVTSAMFSSFTPTFDLSGDFLYFGTERHFRPMFSAIGEWGEFFFTNTTVLACAPLRSDVKWPFAPENDEEAVEEDEDDAGDVDENGDAADDSDQDSEDEEAADDDADSGGDNGDEDAAADENGDEDEDDSGKDDKEDQDGAELLQIELEGLEARARLLPIEVGSFGDVAAGDGKLFYIYRGRAGAGDDDMLMMYDLEEEEETRLLENVGGFALTPDAKKMMVSARGQLFITKAGPGARLDQAVDTRGMLAEIDPRREWEQLIRDNWRLYRDYFYDPGMHGVDWDAQLDRGLRLVKHAANREDVSYIMGLMVAELNVGHAYVGGPGEGADSLPVGLLGCDFQLARDADANPGYRISRIFETAEWELDINGPLSEPGVDVHEGDFLLAVNGVPVDTARSPFAALAGTAGRTTSLTVSDKAVLDDDAREVLVTPIEREYELRHRAWIEQNRRYVEERSGGRIGYIYVRNTSRGGFSDFMRQFVGQFRLAGLIVDERWNGGGLSPHRMVELLDREVQQYWAVRDGVSWRTPHYANSGPKAMLINHAAGSGGDSFPYVFRSMEVGPLIGTRTWGGLVGLSGNPGLIDGGYCSVPTFGFYEPDGTWAVEGYGVAPDIEVVDDPGLLAQGLDPQLDAAIEWVLGEVEANPPQDTPKPAYPDRSGMGVPPEDW